MKITQIQVFDLAATLERGFGWSQGWLDERATTLVRVATDEGVVGWGEGAGSSCISKTLAPLILGANPLDRAGLWERMFQVLYNGNNAVGVAGSALSAIDIALWDIAGKAVGLPVCQLLGGKVRDRVAVYATGLYYTDDELPDRLLHEAQSYVAAGFRGMKTKVGGLPLDQDVRRVGAIREAIGPQVELMVDANQAYNAATAIRIGQALADWNVLWFEEPVNARDLEAYVQVKQAVPMAVAGGENLRTRFDFRDFFARRALDIVQPDVMHCGGLTEMQRIAGMANAFGVQVNPHVWGSPVMIAASLHLASTVPSCPPARAPQPYSQEPVMEFDCTPNSIREELCGPPLTPVDGFLAVPTLPGLGIDVDLQVVQALQK